jgi:DDE superfamily endonuclease
MRRARADRFESASFAAKPSPFQRDASCKIKKPDMYWSAPRGAERPVISAVEIGYVRRSEVTHFYSTKKNTAEMIRMMKVLAEQYRDRKRIYLSWDAASWHISKELFKEIDAHNKSVGGVSPMVETAPLPARAQFLNVIESVFSGMARAIIHNSDYKSVGETKRARESKG